MSDTIRLGFVGTGHRSRAHLEQVYELRDRTYLFCDNDLDYPENTYENHARTAPDWVTDVSEVTPTVTALFDPDGRHLERTASTCADHGDEPALFDSLEAFLSEGVYDAVVVCSPSDAHVEPAIGLLERDVDVLCEKPLATTLADHDRIIDAAEGSSGSCYAAYNLRSSPFFAHLKDELDRGAIGRPGMLACQEVRGPFKESYHYSQARSGGALLDKNCHDFDLFNWYADADPVRVSAFGGQHVLERDTDVLDQATVIVEYENGVVGSLDLCLYAPWGQRTRRYELRGTEGVFRSPEEATTIERFASEGSHRTTIETVGSHMGGDYVQMHRFLSGVRGDADPPGTLLDAKKAAAVSIAAETAIRTGEVVTIDEAYDIEPTPLGDG